MKKLLGILVLGLLLITPSQAEDISEFEIEGMSIGDNLADYINNKKIEYYEIADYFKDNEFTLYESTLSNFKEFELCLLI